MLPRSERLRLLVRRIYNLVARNWLRALALAALVMVVALASSASAFVAAANPDFDPLARLDGMLQNIITEFVGVLVTVVLFDLLINTEDQKDSLVRDVRGRSAEMALRAIDEMRANDWLFDRTLSGKALQKAKLAGANLSFANLRRTDLSGADLRRINGYGVRLRRATLSGADLTGADLKAANLQAATLESANLRGALLITADLDRASCKGAAFDDANLTGAHLRDANLLLATFRGATLRDADLSGARGIDDHDLLSVYRLAGAILPDGRRYDGRCRLWADLEAAQAAGIHPADEAAMAAFYGVPVERYRAGQAWADEHLTIRRADPPAAAPPPRPDHRAPTRGAVQAFYGVEGSTTPGDSSRRDTHP